MGLFNKTSATFIFKSPKRNIILEERLTFNEKGIYLEYGFKDNFKNCKAYGPGLGVETYRLHSAIKLIEGDILIHKKSNRIFIFGPKNNFLYFFRK